MFVYTLKQQRIILRNYKFGSFIIFGFIEEPEKNRFFLFFVYKSNRVNPKHIFSTSKKSWIDIFFSVDPEAVGLSEINFVCSDATSAVQILWLKRNQKHNDVTVQQHQQT